MHAFSNDVSEGSGLGIASLHREKLQEFGMLG
jgi:hypothetical protein